MRHLLALSLVLLGFGGAAVASGVAAADAEDPHAAIIELNDDIIMPVTAGFLERALDKAAEDGAELLIISLDTPGGLLTATNDMVEAMFAARLPVVVYVAPAGARAASAGTFITAAAHIAAMAPGTNIGAATPVSGGGEDLGNKASQGRGRNIDALEQTVFEAVSYTASEALENNIVDLIARDLDELLNMLDGRTVQLEDRTVMLQTSGLEIRTIERTILESFLGFIADPNVILVLMAIGGIGILIEIVVPGLLVPGITGAVLFALAFVAVGNLPVNFLGVGLLLLSMVLFYVEIQVPGTSVAGVGGAIAFILGALLLFGGFTLPGLPSTAPEIPALGLRVSIWVVVGMSALVFALLAFVVRDMAKARKAGARARSDGSSPAGQTGFATTDLAPHGTVHVAGEYWSAVSDSGEPIEEGDEVIVLEADGLTLQVFKASEAKGPLDDEGAQTEPAS